MPCSGGDSAGGPDIGSDSSDSTGAELSAGTHDARARSARARAKTGSHARPATGVAVDSAARAELAEARREAHAHKQANRELQRRIAELERQHAAQLSANAARTGTDLPSSVNTLSAVKQEKSREAPGIQPFNQPQHKPPTKRDCAKQCFIKKTTPR